jgi:hypothetical protein
MPDQKQEVVLMDKNNHYVWNYVGLLLVLVLMVLCALTHVTAAPVEDEEDKNQIKALDGIPQDLAIVYGTGATHAEWGRSTYRISADGKVVYEKTSGRQSTGSKQKKFYSLTKEEMQLIVKKIRDNRFFSLNARYSNTKIRDGWSSFISVTMDQKTHSVSVMNTHQGEFSAIANVISNIIGNKQPTMPE